MKERREAEAGLWALPGFPLVLITVRKNIMTAAAFSFYSFDPPSVMIGVLPKNYTCELLEVEGEFGVNLPNEGLMEAVQICGSLSGRKEDKFARAALTPQKAFSISSLLIQECPVNLECKVSHTVNHPGTHRWFVGRITCVHIDPGYERSQALLYWPREYRRVGEVVPTG